MTSEELKIVRMGERVPNKVVSNGYDLYVKSVDRELMPIYAIELEHIINPIESIELPKDHSTLYQGIELQDLSMIRRSPDILLGIEHMAMLELTVHHQLANGLNLFSSRLGPIVCGKSGSSLIKQNNQAHSAISASSVRQDEELAE